MFSIFIYIFFIIYIYIMSLNEKYLKYKNKYLHIKNLFGGKLNKEQKREYFTKLKNLYTVTGREDKYYSDILKDLLNILYTNIDKDIEEYKEKVEDKDKDKYEDLKKKYYISSKINTDTIDILDIPEFNIRSIQIIILFTELVRLTNKFADTTMQKYFQRDIKIYDIYNNLKLDWENYQVLYDKMIICDQFLSLFGKTIKKYNSISKKFETTIINLWTFKNIKKSRIVCYLDLISPKEIVFALTYEIYYLGIASEMEWADGLELTPFEFLHHDITHSDNRGYNEYNANLEIKFVNYLDTLKLDSTKSKQIYMILFILMHESMSEWLLMGKIDVDTNFLSISPSFVTEINYWTNINFYGSLLPTDLFNTQDENKISNYLHNSFELLKTKWNSFIEFVDSIK